ncbi:cation/acetate symporter ActP [Methylobacterium phyllosphaerae]|uniref:Cation/acetate symporter n=1 Tax=Methylobacterium phyllosphaerae TaxID=418223 RepID=A0AAE8L5J7_9HYPH|nr:cation/acetate symporter ActP [Methylobacterium phyllosphaerae]APT33355.1 cation/acetate symporter ActP [Methylobacterium phyllosphaerae]SFG58198.1 cation/acetate symporter [Methylobacterium phyllosphaerae]
MRRSLLATLLLLGATAPALAGDPGGGLNAAAIGMFVGIVIVTLGITYWAARRAQSADQFYAAGGQISGFQNGIALAGDMISAGALLGLAGLICSSGFDGLIFAVGYATGLPFVVFLVAERLRKLGRYTVADVLATRLSETPIRIFTAIATLVIVMFYLIAQMVGAGQLIRLLFGLDYLYAQILVGALMICYVMFGGMVATTWVQIVKATLLLAAGVAISLLILARFGFDYDSLIAQAIAVHPKHAAMMMPQVYSGSVWQSISLGMTLMLGAAGLPHVLMRFFTVPDTRAARVSVFWAVMCQSGFFALIFVIGFGALAIIGGDPAYLDAKGAIRGGGNMATVHLSHALGGDTLMGLVSAVAFATILAVVAGLTLTGASAVSHDLYARIIGRGRATERSEIRASRLATVGLGIISVLLGIAFQTQNVAYMISLAYAVSCSSTLPLLILALYWSGLTTRGAIAGGVTGLVGATVLTVLGPPVWVKVLGNAAPIFPIDPPTIVTMPLAFLTAFVVSAMDRKSAPAAAMSPAT